jgi:predicted nucleic acid-binding protein
VLKKIVDMPGHHFWPDTVAPTDAKAFTSAAFVGHRQVTDAYLLSLAQHHKGKLATFDNGIAELYQLSYSRPKQTRNCRAVTPGVKKKSAKNAANALN